MPAIGTRQWGFAIMRFSWRWPSWACASEVAALSLDDIDWQSGSVLVHGKGRRQAMMPLRHDVGAAIVAYIRHGRPASPCRRLFLRMLAPHVGFASGCAITMIAKEALSGGYSQLCAPRGASLPPQPCDRPAAVGGQLCRDRPVASSPERRQHKNLCQARHREAARTELALAARCPMSRLRTALQRYVGMRQGLGYKYHGPARRLSDFVTFMEARGAETVTTALAMKRVTLIGRQPSWSIRLTDVCCFAQHLAHFDPMTEVPPQDAVSPARRAKAYIYNDVEIAALLAAALSLPPANALRRWTYHCLFGLIAVARATPFRSARPAPRRRRSRPRYPHHSGDEVRQVAAGPAPCHDGRGAVGLCRATRRASRRAS